MKLSTTNFGHLGVFPETRKLWNSIRERITKQQTQRDEPIQFLNLFAYSGGATLAAAQAGAHCCHVDAAKGMVQWARENAALNALEAHPIRWIVDDVNKFLLVSVVVVAATMQFCSTPLHSAAVKVASSTK